MNDENVSKKQEIINLIKSLLKVNCGEEILSFKEFQDFLNSERITFLKISYLPNSNKLLLINNENNPQVNEREISVKFYKTMPKEIQIDTFFDDVDVCYSRSSSAKLVLKEIESNIIPKISKKDTTILNYLDSFKEKLVNIEKKMQNDKIAEKKLSEDNFDMIFSFNEEIEFWKELNRIEVNDRTKKISASYSKLEEYATETFEINSENVNKVLSNF